MILKHRRLLPGLLCTALLGAGPAAAQQDGARSDADTALLSQIIGLDYGKQRAVYDRLGFAPGDAFWNCLCASAGYGSSSTSQFYHPGTIGDYDKRYSCNQPGDPCVVSGFGCSRHPLPSDAGIWERCGARSVAAGAADPLAALIASAKDVAAGKGPAAPVRAWTSAPRPGPRLSLSPMPAPTGCCATWPQTRSSMYCRRT